KLQYQDRSEEGQVVMQAFENTETEFVKLQGEVDQLQERMKGIDKNKDGIITREEDRAYFAARNANRPSQRLPESVRIVADRAYAGNDNPRQSLDLVLPRSPSTTTPRPLVVFIHGGGWRNGNKQSGRSLVARYVATGKYLGATIGYRLSDEATWPAQIHDCKAAIRWLRAHAGQYGIDPDRIGVMGTSAGGHLVAMLGVSGGIKEMEGTIGEHLDQLSSVQCVVDMFGPTELLTMDDYPGKLVHNSPDSPESRLVGGALQENKGISRNASPVTHVSRNDAPTLIVHGNKDPVVPFNQSERFFELLQKARVDVNLIQMIDGGHGGFQSRELDKRVDAFFARHLLGEKRTFSAAPIQVVPRK
ncbi:MAG: alpha/beta hydrolase, partial [Pirellulaceae bacterium]|nr:alpha/beta hydrolase [Pirellulaceae bacterium]